MSDLSGRALGPYHIIEQLGAGGMATVYKAYQPAMDRYVALKVLPQHLARDPGFRERFSREARTIARLEHRHILPVYDVSEADDIPFLVMRYTAGGTLGDLIAAGPLPFARAVRLTEQVAEALAYAHAEGVVHRDIKPANILLDRDGSALLTDFGIAKIVAGSLQLTAEGALIGTPFYMAPEQAQGKPADARTDIYALGVVLYELATGRRPYIAETPLAVALMHVHDPLPLPRRLNPAIPESLERVILKAMAKRAEDRFQTADELAEALRAVAPLLDTAPTAAGAPAPTIVLPESRPPTPAPARRVRFVPWLVAAGALALVVAGLVALPRLAPSSAASPTPNAAASPAPAATVAPSAPPAPTLTPLPRLRVFGATGSANQAVASGDALWVATTGGLVRYGPDGSARAFTTADGLPFNEVAALTAGPDGTLWVADYERVARVTTAADGISAATGYGYEQGLDIGQIYTMFVDPTDGSAWAGGDRGVRYFDGSMWKQPDVPLDDPVVTSLTGPVVTLLRARDGAFWVGRAGGGLLRWDGARWSAFANEQGVAPAETYQLLQSSDGTLWSAAAEQGLLRFDPAQGRWAQAQPPPEGGRVFHVGQLADGRLWLTTSDGIRQSEDTGTSWRTVEVPDGYLGTGEVVQTSDGQIWVGGVSRFADGAWTRLPAASEMPFDHVAAIVPAPDGKLWALARYGGPAAIVDPTTLAVTVHPLDARIYTVAFSADVIWFGTSDGVFRLHEGTRRTLTSADGLPSDEVRLLMATDTDLWIGTDNGLARYDLASEEIATFPEFDGGIVQALLLAPDGAIWAGSHRENTDGYGLLGRFDGEEWRFWRQGDLPNSEDAVEVTRLSSDAEGRIWLLTWSSGLYRWDGEAWDTWTYQDGAPQSTVLAATPRGDEMLIGGTLGGSLFRWTRDGWSTVPIDGLSGVVEDVLVGEDGALWLATDDNLLRVAPD